MLQITFIFHVLFSTRTCRLVGIEFLLHRRATAFGHAFPGHFTEGIGWLVGGLVGLWRSISVPSTSHFGKVVLKLSKDTKPTVKFQDDPSQNATELNSILICIYIDIHTWFCRSCTIFSRYHPMIAHAETPAPLDCWSNTGLPKWSCFFGSILAMASTAGLAYVLVLKSWWQRIRSFSSGDGQHPWEVPYLHDPTPLHFWLTAGAVALSAHVNRKAEEVWQPKVCDILSTYQY